MDEGVGRTSFGSDSENYAKKNGAQVVTRLYIVNVRKKLQPRWASKMNNNYQRLVF